MRTTSRPSASRRSTPTTNPISSITASDITTQAREDGSSAIPSGRKVESICTVLSPITLFPRPMHWDLHGGGSILMEKAAQTVFNFGLDFIAHQLGLVPTERSTTESHR